jgi:large subunit ribosomal protein L22
MGKKAKPRRFADNESMAYGRLLRTSPQKLNLVVKDIRGKDCETALNVLSFSRRRIAGEVRKILLSAIANAENNQQLDVDRLYVAEASVGRELVMKRWRARARGRVGRIIKPLSNLTVVIREREEAA